MWRARIQGIALVGVAWSVDARAVPDRCDEGGGSVEASALASEADERVEGAAREHGLGASVAHAGDVDGDGWPDLMIGVPGDDAHGTNAGVVLLYLSDGAPASLARQPVRLVGAAPGDRAGTVVAPAGDTDGDGFDDVLVAGAPSARGRWPNGAAWLVRGGPALAGEIPLDDAPALTGAAAGDGFGAALLGAGDVNDDGFDDLVIGAPTADANGPDSGGAWLFLGPILTDRSALDADASWTGEEPDDRAGSALAALGEGAVVIGAPQRGPGLQANGAVYLVDARAGSHGLGAAPAILDGSGNERLGWSLSPAGDTDGDGLAELWIGARHWATNKRGAAWLVPADIGPGRAAVADLALAALRGRDGQDWFGGAVSGGVDLDGDGLSDVVVGADRADGPALQTGAAWTLTGPFDGELVVGADFGRHAGDRSGDRTGAAVALLPDVDGDGFGDVLIGSPAADPGARANAGAASLLRGGVDRIDLVTWYPDADGDGWGALAGTQECTPLPDHVTSPGDCDDDNPAAFPYAVETDCGSDVDLSCDGSTGAVDADGDGARACDGDCDDADPAVGPAALERCGNGVDDDCNGEADDSGAVDATRWFADSDLDGYGADGFSVVACAPPALFLAPPVTTGGDCADADPTRHPGAVERCDLRDEDCDGLVDDGAIDGATDFFADADGDGFGDRAQVVRACEAPQGYTLDVRDCDDADPLVNPNATETCDALDNDCDGLGYLGGPVHSPTWRLSANGPIARLPGALPGGRDALAVFDATSDRVLALAASPSSGAFGLDPRGADWPLAIAWQLTGVEAAALAAGDFDGDGLIDLAIGSPTESAGAPQRGAVRIVYGVLSASPQTGLLRGDEGDHRAGAALASGDLDGDGDDELVIGAPGAGGDRRGLVALLPGGGPRVDALGAPLGGLASRSGDLARDGYGATVVIVPDTDGDGAPEIAVGAPDGGADDAGYVDLLNGGLLRLRHLDGGLTGAAIGVAIAGGDTTGDGLAELLITSIGRAWLVPPGGDGLVSALASTTLRFRLGAEFGRAAAMADVDADGLADLILGAPSDDTVATNAGVVALLYGGPAMPAEVDASALESFGRLEDGPGSPTRSAANADLPEGALLYGAANQARLGLALLPGVIGVDADRPDLVVAGADGLAGYATGAYGLDLVPEGGDSTLVEATGETVWEDRDRDGQAPLGAEPMFVCAMHAPQDEDGADAFVRYAALVMDCDDDDPLTRRGAPDRDGDGVDRNCDGDDAAVINFPPVVTSCTIGWDDGRRVADTDRVQSADTLRALPTGMDPEGGPIAWTLTWTGDDVGALAVGETLGAPGVWRDRLLGLSCAPADANGAAPGLDAAPVPVHNAPPVLTACGLSPAAPTTESTMALAPDAFDVEGDPVTFTASWARNDAQISGETAFTLGDAWLVRGDRIEALCDATDGRDPASTLRSGVIRVVNAPPVVTSILAFADTGAAFERSTLYCVAEFFDADGDETTPLWSWTVNAAPVPHANQPTLTGAAFNRDDAARCSVTPRDGVSAGAPRTSAPVVVQNTPPALTGAAVVTGDGLAVTERSTLACDGVGLVDDDGDTIEPVVTWLVDDAPVVTQDTLTGAWFDRADAVRCALTPRDDREAGAPATSPPVIVENSPASAPLARVAPIVADTDDPLRCELADPATDPDPGDVLHYTASWTLDGAPWAGATELGAHPGDTVPAGAAEAGVWACTLTVDDGTVAVDSAPALRHVFEAWRRPWARMGENHACFVLSDSSLRCQGLGTSGQLGVDRAGFGDALGDAPGEVGATQPPVLLPPGVGVELLAVGGRHTCVVGTDGALRCWGANDRGQLGLGHTLPVGLDTTTLGEHLEAVTLPAHVGLAQIEAWGDTTCARTADGLLYCWGANSFGQLGQDHALDVGAAPGQPGDLAPIHTGGRAAVDVAVGGEFVCALFVDGGVRCWGKNGVGQLGQGSTASRGDSPGEMAALAPTLLGGGTVVDLDAGGVHACAVFSDGRVKCWGHNSDGQLGQGLTGPRGDGPGEMGVALPVVNLGAGRIAREISAGATNSCAIFQDRTWKCWGSNAGGGNANNQVLGAWGDNLLEMGDNLPVRALPGGALPASVDMGYQGGCAITACGAVHCWGVNTSGQAGVGSVDVVRTFPAAQALPAGLAGFEADVCP